MSVVMVESGENGDRAASGNATLPADGLLAEIARLRDENAHLRAEREALAHFVTVVDPRVEHDVSLTTLVTAAVLALGGRSGALYRYSSDQQQTTAAYFAGYAAPEEARRLALTQAPASVPIEAEVCATGRGLIARLTPDEAVRPRPDSCPAAVPLLIMPLQRAGGLIGCLVIDRAPGAAPFTGRDAAFGLSLAIQAALMIEQVDHHASTHQRALRAEALREIGRQLSAELDFERFLDSVAQHLTTVMSVRDCVLGLWDEATQGLSPLLYVCDGVRRDWQVTIHPGESRGLTSAVIEERQTIHVPNYLAECQRRGLAPVTPDGDWSSLAWVGVPLLAAGRLVGVLIVERREGIFSEDEVAILETLGGHIAAAMENVRLYAEVRQLASSDSLTGLANHRHVHERLEQELIRAREYARPLAIAMLDLNNFKYYNDTYGHQAGDQLLRTIAQALLDETRATDVVGRYGGDEFLIVLPEAMREEAAAALERVQQRLAAIPWLFGWEATSPVTISIGLAVFPDDANLAHELIALADQGLYDDKRAHRAHTALATSRGRIPA